MTEYVAVLDRFEGDLAVLVVEREGDAIDELVVPRAVLPSEGRHQNAVFDVTIGDETTELRYDASESADRLGAAQSRFDRLARRPPGRDES